MAAQFSSLSDLYNGLLSIGSMENNSFLLTNKEVLQNEIVDQLVMTSVFAKDKALQDAARSLIHALARDLGIWSCSHYELYKAIGRQEITGFTIPAINIRALTYDSSRIIFRLAKKHAIGACILELARSEMGYSDQDPSEFAASVLAAAIKEGFTGPVFLQGDHYQVNEAAYTTNPENELQALKDLIKTSLEAELYNIDIDASTVVDLTKPTTEEQQKVNSKITAELTNFIREIEPSEQKVSIGGEIGHIGDRNSTDSDFTAFMDQYLSQIKNEGITKVSVQTGSSHGGTIDAEGNVQEVTIDFSVIENIGKIAKKKYQLGGVVQHGASTLPLELYPTFVEKKTLEIHLSTIFMTIIYDTMPESLREEMRQWVNENCGEERKPDWNDTQFFYKLRKKAIGPFKEKLWNLTPDEKEPILSTLEKEYLTIFERLNVFNTLDVVKKYTSTN